TGRVRAIRGACGGGRGRAARPGRSVPVRDVAAVAGTAPPHPGTRGGGGGRGGRAARRPPRGGGGAAGGAAARALAGPRRGGREEAERREFFEALLSGRGGVADLLDRGERLGLRLVGPHQVLLAGSDGQGEAGSPAGTHIDAVVAEAAAPSSSLVLSRHGRLVVIVGSADGGEAGKGGGGPAPAPARPAGGGTPGGRGAGGGGGAPGGAGGGGRLRRVSPARHRGGSRSGGPIRGRAAWCAPTTRRRKRSMWPSAWAWPIPW